MIRCQDDVVIRGFFSRDRYTDFRLQTFLPYIPRPSRQPAPLRLLSEGLRRLCARRDVARLPYPLRILYAAIDGTVDSGYGEDGGFSRLGSLYLDYIRSRIPIAEGTPPDLLECPRFFTSPNGDSLVARGREAYWFLHETNSFKKAGDLSEVVSGYFRAELDGRPWLRDPYVDV